MGKVRAGPQSTVGAGKWDSAADFAIGVYSVAWTQAVQVKLTLFFFFLSHCPPAVSPNCRREGAVVKNKLPSLVDTDLVAFGKVWLPQYPCTNESEFNLVALA